MGDLDGTWPVDHDSHPDVLAGRRVTCHRVVLADILNAGAIYDPAPVVIDRDLVTGDSGANVLPFIDAISEQLSSR